MNDVTKNENYMKAEEICQKAKDKYSESFHYFNRDDILKSPYY